MKKIYYNMPRRVFIVVIAVHYFVALINSETSAEETRVCSTSQDTPETKEELFRLDEVFDATSRGTGVSPGYALGGNQLTASYPNQQNPQRNNWEDIQTPQQSPNKGQGLRLANFKQYPSQNGYGVWNGQKQNPIIQKGNWQNVLTSQKLPNLVQSLSYQINNSEHNPPQNGYGAGYGQYQAYQHPMIQQGNLQSVQTPHKKKENSIEQTSSLSLGDFNSANSQLVGQSQNIQPEQDDESNSRAPQEFLIQKGFSQQYNAHQYLWQPPSNFGPDTKQNLNTGTLDDIPTENGFQNQNLLDNSGNPVAILGKPVPVSSTSVPDRIVFQDEWV